MKLIGPFSEIITMRNLPLKGTLLDDQLEIMPNAGIIIRDDKIQTIGEYKDLYLEAKAYNYVIEEVSENSVAMPGLIDAHTHICWAGSRASDYAMRISGKSYLDIARAGGGIWSTVINTRKAAKNDLIESMKQRVNTLLSNGVTTLEVKSGYGLSAESEIKMLEAINEVNNIVKADIVPTCLAAHIPPHEHKDNPDSYLSYIISELFPVLIDKKLTNRIDIFIEDTAFSTDLAENYLKQAKNSGFQLAVHADQFSSGGSKLAVDLGAISADHLEASTNTDLKYVANSNTTAIALPGASLGLGDRFMPARKFLDYGGSLAIASDWNPGSAPMGDLLVQAAILGIYEKLSTAETLAAITSRAANALGLNNRGIIDKGYFADIIAFPCQDHRDILYHQGMLKPNMVLKNGEKIK